MKKSGFTLTELLAVIVILGIIMAISLPVFKNTIDSSKDKLYNTTVDNLKKAARDYFLQYGEEINGLKDTGIGYITIGDMLKKGVLDTEVKNPKTGAYFNEADSIKITRQISGSYSYDLVLEYVPLTIQFGNDGSSAYAKTRSTTVTVSDDTEVNPNSLKYQWSTSTTAPTEASFSNSFDNGDSISTPAGVTGEYYLWVLAKNNSDIATIRKSKAFYLDNIAPVITLLGTTPVTIDFGSTYTDAGAIASDNINGNLTNSIEIVSDVNPNAAGSYTVTYSVSDSSGNVATPVVRTVNIEDATPPVVVYNPNGNTTYAKTRSATVTVTDDTGVNLNSLKYQWNTSTTTPTEASFSTTFTNGGSISSPSLVTGGYYLWILAKDTSNNTTITRSNVFNLDNAKPVITMLGSSPVTVNIGSTYTDAGATANDNINGNLTSSIQIVSNVNPNVIGTYTVTYNVSDSSGNPAVQMTRTVNVVDTTSPVVAFGQNGNTTYAKTRSTTVTASDAGGVNTSSLKYQWNTSTTTPTEASFSTTFTNGGSISSPSLVTGGYYLWILAKDTSNNTTITRSNVFNLDNTKPVITMLGSSSITIDQGISYTDAGATASDNSLMQGDLTASIVTTNIVNVNVVGTYTVTYNVSDTAGNAATPVVRTVNVLTYGYVSSGLYAMYDGIANGGINIHNDNAAANKGIWKDISGNNRDGTLTSFGYTSTSGWLSNGLILDGVDDGVSIGNQYIDLFNGSVTMEMVVKFDQLNSRDIMLGNYSVTNNINWEKYTSDYGRLYWNEGNPSILTTTGIYNSTSTMQISIIIEKSNNKVRFLKNGTELYSITDSLIGSYNYNWTNGWIGRDSRTSDVPLKGTIYAFRIYNRVLNSTEISSNYSKDRTRFGF